MHLIIFIIIIICLILYGLVVGLVFLVGVIEDPVERQHS